MTMPWHEWFGLIGVLLILLAYFLLQAGKLKGHGLSYQGLNAAGAIGVMLSLLFGTFNLPAFLLEVAWLAISIFGMVVATRRRRGGM